MAAGFMARQFSRSYAHGHTINADGSVSFECSTDTAEWPWLELGPHHPVVVQAQNFWTSVGAIMALGGMEDGQWSALTWTDWECGEAGVGIAVRGHYERETTGGNEQYLIVLFDAGGHEIVRMRGRGVVFRNRDFEKWRGVAKSEAQAQKPEAAIVYAPREALGIGAGEHPLISVGKAGDPQTFDALVTPENGLAPANRVLSGSGDHVNSVHMIEMARQALCLLTGDPQTAMTGGEMTLNRYVELGTPIRLKVDAQDDHEARFTLEQLGRVCAQLTLRWQAG